MEAIASTVVRNFKSPGIFAVEMFVDKNGDVFVNETAPRVHNSGHHTIEAHYSSQFDMLWRLILGYPFGNTDAILPSIMVNIIGAEGCNGDVKYEGLEDVMKIDNAFVHIYGKRQTKPGRKLPRQPQRSRPSSARSCGERQPFPARPGPLVDGPVHASCWLIGRRQQIVPRDFPRSTSPNPPGAVDR